MKILGIVADERALGTMSCGVEEAFDEQQSELLCLLALCPTVHNFLSFVISFINHPFEALYEFIRFRGSTDRKLALFLGF